MVSKSLAIFLLFKLSFLLVSMYYCGLCDLPLCKVCFMNIIINLYSTGEFGPCLTTSARFYDLSLFAYDSMTILFSDVAAASITMSVLDVK